VKQHVARALFGVLLIGSVVLGAAPALACEAGDIILRVGAIGTLSGAGTLADADPEILF